MNHTIEKIDNVSVMYVSGEINAITCVELEEALNKLLEEGETRLILDFEDVPYISSAGLRVLLVTAKKLYGNGTLAISRVKEEVREVLEMVGFANIMQLYDDLEEAKTNVAGE